MRKVIAVVSILLIIVLIIVIPSVLIAYGLTSLSNTETFSKDFVARFIIIAGIVYVIGLLFNTYAKWQHQKLIIKNDYEQVKEIMSQSVEISCAYCKKSIIIPIKLNRDNIHTCPHCKQTNKIIFQFMAAQISTPLEIAPLTNLTTTEGK